MTRGWTPPCSARRKPCFGTAARPR
jgi:hypothetical protein